MQEKFMEEYSNNFEAQKIDTFPESAINKRQEEIKDEVKSSNKELI